MAKRPKLVYRPDEEDERHQRGEEARRRVLSGESRQQAAVVSKERPKLVYIPDVKTEEEMKRDHASEVLNVPNAIRNFQDAHKAPPPPVDSVVRLPQSLKGTIPNRNAGVQQAFAPKTPIKGQTTVPHQTFPERSNMNSYEAWYENNVAHTPLGGLLGGMQKADRAVSNVKAGALDTATLGATQGLGRAAINSIPGGKQNLEPIRQERMETPSYKTGEALGYLPPGAAAERVIAKAGGKALAKAPKLVQGLTKAAGAGALDAAAQEGGDVAFRGREFDPENVALGAGVGAAFPLAGRGAKFVADKSGLTKALTRLFSRNGVSEITDDIINGVSDESPIPTPDGPTLALPAGRTQPGVNMLPKGEQPIIGGAGATTARMSQRTNPYREKYNQLIGLAHETKFTPGRELEELEQLWSSIADREDPSLDDLIKLAHPTHFNKVEPGLASKAKNYQQARNVAGVPSPVRTSEERLGVAPLEEATEQRKPWLPAIEQQPVEPVPTKVDIPPAALPKQNQTPKQKSTKQPVQPALPQLGRKAAGKEIGEINNPVQAPKSPVASIPSPKTEQIPPAAPAAKANVNPVPPPQRPKTAGAPKFISTLDNSPKPPQGFKEKLKAKYTPISNQETVNLANKRVSKDIEEAASYVLGHGKATPEKVTVAHRLIDEFNKQGNYQRAVDIADKVAQELTKAGQTVQAASIYNRLTTEGILVHAQRIVRKTNEALPVGRKEVEVTPELAAQLTDLTETVQKMTGVKDLASDVTNILEKAKRGEKLAAGEADMLRRFVNESKQFIREVSKRPAHPPRTPRAAKDKRIRDNVASFLDAQEQAAKERLKARGTRASALPLDIFADYSIIGAAKLGKGSIKFTDWSEQMAKDLGEEVRPYLRSVYERSVETYEKATKKITTTTVSEAEKIAERVIKNKAISEKEADSIRVLAQKVSGLSGDAKRMASQDLQVVLQTLERPTLLKKVSSAQTMAQLFNPKTLLTRNPLGNELFYRVERVNKLLATPIDWTRVKLFGGQRSVTFRTHNQGQYWKNFIEGGKAGWKGVNVNGLETQFDLSSPAFSNKWNPLTYLEKAMGATLKSFDNAAYMRAVNNSIGELATLRAVNEGKGASKELIQKYIREADENMLKIADQYGKYATFQDNNVISKGLMAIKKGMNFGKDFGFGDMVLKYPKTPGALLMRAIEYSPVGFARSLYMAARPLLKKEPNTAEVMMGLSRSITGSIGFTGLGYYLYEKNIITGSASKDRDIRDLQKSSGKGQYQVNLSALMRWVRSGFDPEQAGLKEGDSMYTYDWMQPISIAASIGANIGQNRGEGKGATSNIGKTLLNSLEGGVNTLTEQSVLSGLKQAVEGYPGQTVMDKIMDILSDMPASFVPSILNQVKQIGDNERRETYDPRLWKQSLNKAIAKVPFGASETLPQQFDTLGKPKKTWQNNSLANVFLNPGSPSKYELSPEAKFVVDLINETDDETLAPRVPGKKATIDGVSVKLTGDQFSRLQQLQGEETAKKISKINPDASAKTKSKKMKKGLTDAGKTAQKTLIKEYDLK